MNTPRLLSIQIAEDKGLPMQALESVEITETGIRGDRYATGNGAFSNSRIIDRHVSLIEIEAIEAVWSKHAIEVTFADTRRNLLTIGIRLNDLVGKTFRIGDVLVEGVELCDPCGRPGILSGKEQLKRSFKDVFHLSGGLRARVLQTGEIHTGDSIILAE